MTPGWVAVGTLAVALIGAIGVLIRLFPEIRQMRAQTHQATVASVIAEDAAGDARLAKIIEAQTQSLIEPLRAEVARQGIKIAEQGTQIDALETEVRSTRRLYRRTLDLLLAHVRHIAVLSGILNDHSIPYPAPPAIPADIHDDM